MNCINTFILPSSVTVLTIYFVNTDLKLELPINVWRYCYSNKKRGEENFLIFINQGFLPGPEDMSLHSLTTTRDFSEVQRYILLILIICEIPFLIFRFFKIKIHHV